MVKGIAISLSVVCCWDVKKNQDNDDDVDSGWKSPTFSFIALDRPRQRHRWEKAFHSSKTDFFKESVGWPASEYGNVATAGKTYRVGNPSLKDWYKYSTFFEKILNKKKNICKGWLPFLNPAVRVGICGQLPPCTQSASMVHMFTQMWTFFPLSSLSFYLITWKEKKDSESTNRCNFTLMRTLGKQKVSLEILNSDIHLSKLIRLNRVIQSDSSAAFP